MVSGPADYSGFQCIFRKFISKVCLSPESERTLLPWENTGSMTYAYAKVERERLSFYIKEGGDSRSGEKAGLF
jgi:hypothetical protein